MINGKFVTLRIIEKGDIEMIRKWRNSPELYSFFASRDFISQIQQENWFATKATAKDSLFLLIINNTTSEPIGMTHLESIDCRNRNAEWGIYIADPKDRVGIFATEAVYLLFNYVFDYLNLVKIYGNTLATNQRGRRFHKSVGFTEEAQFERHIFVDGDYVDLIWIALFRSTWNDTKRKELASLISGAKLSGFINKVED